MPEPVLCRDHKRAFDAHVREVVRTLRQTPPSCPVCAELQDRAALVAELSELRGQLRVAEERAAKLERERDRAHEEAQRMNDVAAAAQACAAGALERGRDHHEASLRTIAEAPHKLLTGVAAR